MRADARRNLTKVLAAADEVFAEHGPGASTGEIARRAGVAVGTVFRHFPTKADLVGAVFVDRVRRLVDEARDLAGVEDAGAAFFGFCARLAELSSAKYAFADALAAGGVGIDEVAGDHPEVLRQFQAAVDVLLRRAQEAGAVRTDVRTPEVLALLFGVARAAEGTTGNAPLRERVLGIVYDGLRP